MGKDSLPLLFGPGKLENISVGSWYNKLLADKDAYARCYVPTFTRVKNLGSKYMHEYVQFIVEDRLSGKRARVYAERMNEKDVDVVTIGRDEKTPRPWDELPLPLTTFLYQDQSKQPSLLDIAKILNRVSVVGGKYDFYGNNCFWFAYTTFNVVKLAFQGNLKNWLWVNPGSTGGLTGHAWGLGFPTMFKVFFQSTANKFNDERILRTDYMATLELREKIAPEAFVQTFNQALLSPEGSEAYIGWANSLGIELQKENLGYITSQAEQHVKELDQKGELHWSQEFDRAAQDLTEKLLADPEMLKYIAKYDAQPLSADINDDVTGNSGGDVTVRQAIMPVQDPGHGVIINGDGNAVGRAAKAPESQDIKKDDAAIPRVDPPHEAIVPKTTGKVQDTSAESGEKTIMLHDIGPKDEESRQLAEALKVLCGRVLLETGFGH